MRLKQLLIVFFICHFSGSNYAQNYIDLLQIKHSNTPGFDNTSIQELEGEITLPLPLIDKKHYIIPNIQGKRQSHNNQNENSKLTTFQYNFGLGHFGKYKNGWSSIIKYDHFNYFQKDGHQSNYAQKRFAAFVTKEINDKLYIGLGVLKSYSFGSHLALPILDLGWKFNEKWMIYAFLPQKLRIFKQVNSDLRIGYEMNVINAYYTARDIEDGSFFSEVPVDFPWAYFRSSLYYDRYIKQSIAFKLEVGFDNLREINFYDSEEKMVQLDSKLFQSFNMAPFFKVGIYYRIRT